jgi:ribosome-associated protein
MITTALEAISTSTMALRIINRHPRPEPELTFGPGSGIERPSKSRRKADAHALQTLGRDLTELSLEQLARITMDDQLRESVLAFKRTRSHEGKRRQMQLVGKLMRHSDAEPLREAVAALKLGRAEDSLALHKAEAWRDALVAGDDAVTRFATEHRGVDVQQLRAVVRNVRQERALQAVSDVAQPSGPAAATGGDARHGKAYRDLFKLIREAMQSVSASDGDA